MEIKHITLKSGSVIVLAVSLMLLPGCMDWIKEKIGGKPVQQEQMPAEGITSPEGAAVSQEGMQSTDDKDVLVWMDGKPLITIEKLKTEKNDLMESNPQLRAMIAFMDEKQLDRNLTDGLTNQAVVDKYVASNKIDQSKEYKQEMDRMMRSVKHMLNTKFFAQELSIVVGDAQVKEFYDKNKESMPNLLVSRGGVKAEGVLFNSQAKAQDFVKKVQEVGSFQKAAEATGMKDKVKDFKLVHDQSLGMDNTLRDEIVKLNKFPTNKVIRVDDKTYWVVHASAKEETKYRPLDQVKGDLKLFLEKEKRAEML
ncbi:MAG: peptidylprolyl isomerase, partial [bacterium]|nr:peptidylprolyl isomerase [bacterium]